MDNDKQKQYIYTKFQQGIADSPEDGFASMRNVNVERYPGSVTPGYATFATTSTFSSTITRAGSSNYLNITSSTTLYNGQAVVITSTGSVPGGLTSGQVSFLNNVSFVSGTSWQATVENTLESALTAGGEGVILSSGGSGVITMATVNMSTVKQATTYYPFPGSGNPLNFCIDSNGRTWVQNNIGFLTIGLTKGVWYYLLKLSGGNEVTYTSANTQGLTLYASDNGSGNSWLFTAGNGSLDVIQVNNINLSSASIPAWTIGFETFTNASGVYHFGFVSQTGVMYFTDGNYLIGFVEITGKTFSPSDSTTYVFVQKALVLPFFEIATCLENLGDNLIIGGLNSNLLYPWNEIQTAVSTPTAANLLVTAYQTPMRVGEKSTYALKNINNVLFILAGVKGIVYQTSGYVILPLKKIPEYITGGSVQWGGIEKIDGNLIFGFLGTQGDANGNQNGGVGKIFLTEQAQLTSVIANGTLIIDQTVASGSITTLPTALLTYISPAVAQPSAYETYFLGSANGMDVVDLFNVRSDGSAYIECTMEHAGSVEETRAFEGVGVEFLQPLASSQGVNIQFRTALNGSYTAGDATGGNLVNFNFTTYGAITNQFENSGIADTYLVQLKVILTSDGFRDPILSGVWLK